MNPAVFLSEKKTSSKPIAWRKFIEYTLCDLFLEVHDNDRHQNEEYTQKIDYSKSFMHEKRTGYVNLMTKDNWLGTDARVVDRIAY
jgi:hypothetical protein